MHVLSATTPFYYGTYDDGVYFSTALRFVHGYVPYSDGVFLQPPGIVLANVPFALAADFVGDAHAFVAARGAFCLIGGLNAALISAILLRMGRPASIAGGLIYALSWPAIYTERTVTLETLGTTSVLLGLFFLRMQSGRRRWPVLAGVAAAAAVDVKVWYVPIFVLLAVYAWRRVVPFLIGGAVAGLIVYVPFFVVAPAKMWRDVVVAQLGRPNQGLPLLTRVRSILGVDVSSPDRPWWQIQGTVGVVIVLLLLAVMCGLALSMRTSRIFVALLAASAAVLLFSPSYLTHYATLTAGPFALVGGAGVAWVVAAMRGHWVSVVAVAFGVLVAAGINLAQDAGIRTQGDPVIARRLPTAALTSAARAVKGCLVSDDPTVLLLMNRLSQDLERGCNVQTDPSGIGFVLSTPGVPQVYRPQNPRFQREIVDYLHAADAYLLVRGQVGLGLSPATARQLGNDPVVATVGHFRIRSARP